jgi:hypothetical protein
LGAGERDLCCDFPSAQGNANRKYQSRGESSFAAHGVLKGRSTDHP